MCFAGLQVQRSLETPLAALLLEHTEGESASSIEVNCSYDPSLKAGVHEGLKLSLVVHSKDEVSSSPV